MSQHRYAHISPLSAIFGVIRHHSVRVQPHECSCAAVKPISERCVARLITLGSNSLSLGTAEQDIPGLFWKYSLHFSFSWIISMPSSSNYRKLSIDRKEWPSSWHVEQVSC